MNAPSTACRSLPTPLKKPAAPTPPSSATAAGRGRTSAAAGSSICSSARNDRSPKGFAMRPPEHSPRDLTDRVFRKTLENVHNLQEFLQEALPEHAAAFDCANARLLPREF